MMVLAAALVVGSALAPVANAQIFSSYAGTLQAGAQLDTGLDLAHSGNVTDWSKSGSGTMHAADLGGGDWAIMFYQNNVITLTTGIAANDNGVQYTVEFDYGPAVYSIMSQATAAGDGLLVEVLRGDNSVLASDTFEPGAWSSPGNVDLSAGLKGTLQYTGDGTGVVRLWTSERGYALACPRVTD